MIICIAAFVIGVCAALFFPFVIPPEFLPYAGFSVLYIAWGAVEVIRLTLLKKLNMKIFISGLFCGLIFALIFIIAGGKLDLDIYPICTLVLGVGFIKSCYGIFKYFIGKNMG